MSKVCESVTSTFNENNLIAIVKINESTYPSEILRNPSDI